MSVSPFGSILRHWRGARRMSQMDLGLSARVSAKHISFVETGRAQPSREMVLNLASVLGVPLRERNALLQAAGYAAAYDETGLGEARMAQIRHALALILRQNEPFGAVVLDRVWDIVMVNEGYARFLALLGVAPPALPTYEVLPAPRLNALVQICEPDGLRRHVRNWDAVVDEVLARARVDLALDRDPARRAVLDAVLAYPGVAGRARRAGGGALVIPVEIAFGDLVVRLFTTMTTLGTAEDITLQELRIESFHAADEATLRLAHQLAAGARE